MNPIIKREYCLTTQEKNAIHDITNMVLRPHLSTSIINDKYERLMNILSDAKIIEYNQLNDISDIITEVRGIISTKRQVFLNSIDDVPEQASGIFMRPKEHYRLMIEVYNQQLKALKELVLILTTETEPDEDDIAYAQSKGYTISGTKFIQ